MYFLDKDTALQKTHCSTKISTQKEKQKLDENIKQSYVEVTNTYPSSGCNTRQWGLSNPWMTAFLKDPSSLATLICFLLAS